MSTESGGDSEMEVLEEGGQWSQVKRKVQKKAKRRKTNELTQQEINSIILGPSTQKSQLHKEQKTTTSKNYQTDKHSNKNSNYSPLMKQILAKNFKHLFYIHSETNYTRVNFTDFWSKIYPNSKDVILKTNQGLLLKTDTDKDSIIATLDRMIEKGNIIRYSETSTNTKPSAHTPTNTSYSVIIGSVEHEIEEQAISEFLTKCQLEHRYCRRIISKATNKATTLIRIITGSQETSETLLTEGLYYKYKHYPVFPSKPPTPSPKPCGRCHSFQHTTESCTAPIRCSKCQGSHATDKCTSMLPPKCNSCHAEDHQAWSYRCPNRPRSPIDGVPNVQIKSLNKKTHEIPDAKKKCRIHQPVTIHDTVINTYVDELNNPLNTNREELLKRLLSHN